MHRFFVAAPGISGAAVTISGRDAEHIRALRIRRGEIFTVCDGAGADYVCRMTEVGRGSASAEILEKRASAGEPGVRCTVYAAFSKGDRPEAVVRKSVELGAAAVSLFISARCVARPDAAAQARRAERLRIVAEEAAKQSGRGIIPEVSISGSFEEAVRDALRTELALFFYEEERELALRQALGGTPAPKTVSIITGPEGGFEPGEAELAASAGCRVVSLGPRILRCDTAPAAALTCVMMYYGQFERVV
jgi:16S rRNA (uracil1498-N3)-methyltransferase